MTFITENRRALILLVAALGIYLALSELVFPFYDRLQAALHTVSEKEDQVRKYKRALVRKGNYPNLILEAEKRTAEAESHFIGGAGEPTLSTELQSIVEQAGSKTGLAFAQRSVSDAKPKDNSFSETSMTLIFECQPSQLTQFLMELRNGNKRINISSLQIAPVEAMLEIPKEGSVKKSLRINMTVTALSLLPNQKRG